MGFINKSSFSLTERSENNLYKKSKKPSEVHIRMIILL